MIFSNASDGCLSFTLTDGLIGFQDEKLPTRAQSPRPHLHQPELAAFIAGAKNGDFDHLLDYPSPHPELRTHRGDHPHEISPGD